MTFSNACTPLQHIPDASFRASRTARYLYLPLARSVGGEAFADCARLRFVRFSPALRLICEDAFAGCGNLAYAGLPAGVRVLGERAFARTHLVAAPLPAGLRIIGNSCFEDCDALVSAVIPASVAVLGASAFSGCVRLRHVRIDAPLAAIRDGCFARCALDRIDLPDTVSYIGRDAFCRCQNLRLVTLPNTPSLRLRASAFFDCPALCHVVRRHASGQEHRVFDAPPDAVALMRKLPAFDRSVRSAPAALFRLAFPYGLDAEQARRMRAVVAADPARARAYLARMRGVLARDALAAAARTLDGIDRTAPNRYNETDDFFGIT